MKRVNIVLGTDLDRAYIEEIGSVVNNLNLGDKVFYHVLFKDVAIMESLNCFKDANISVITKAEDVEKVVNKLHRFRLIVRSEAEFAVMDKFAQELAEGRCVFEPIYDDNDQFFVDNVLLDLEDIRDCKLSKREVFAHIAVNVNYFGILTITADGGIYSDLWSEAVGSIERPLGEAIFCEMERNHLWRRVRDNDVCSQCLYQWLCPSPFTYEQVMGRKTICKLYQ
ncbi:hypothetical protein BN938_0437 [Mucinivorans hirudinis]|uniref:4Fe4S-binding SPASM domain-containing protein n=1 Tax=Mucinivorans hirudinis TaxID=1433126 RepID=A0A060R6G4_9BACT|nr:hypothetical protein BN938_0437 [Mucinivorans hirudinis]